MDQLSKFLVDTFQPTTKTAAALMVPTREPTFLEKWAYGVASMGGGDSNAEFLQQFEGSPLLPQAVALAEQELAMESQALQKRMQRSAEQQTDTYAQDCIQQDGIRIQKQQLLLQLYKMKAMTPAPKPGDAVIGQPQPGAEQLGSELGGGTTGEPVAEQAPKLSFVQVFKKAAISKFAAKMKKASLATQAEGGLASLIKNRPAPMSVAHLLSAPGGSTAIAEGIAAKGRKAIPVSSVASHAPDLFAGAKGVSPFSGMAPGAVPKRAPVPPPVPGSIGSAQFHSKYF